MFAQGVDLHGGPEPQGASAEGRAVVPLADAGPLPPLAQHPAEAGAARGGGSPVPDWSGAETSVPKLPPLAS
jgi:hypothetical protein